MEPPTGPSHLVRAHCASGAIPITSLYVSLDNERIYSADASGLVVVTSTRSLRPLFTWTAHASASVLGVQEWGDAVITFVSVPECFDFGFSARSLPDSHGRDNQLHVWDRFESDQHAQYDGGERSLGGGSAALPTSVLPVPRLLYSLDVNALNYCRFSMLSGSPLYESEKDDGSVDSGTGHERAFIAVPNLVDSALVSTAAFSAPFTHVSLTISQADVWELPSKTRVHAAIGKADPHTRERGTGATGE
jgi:ASTRA-associated protein 1